MSCLEKVKDALPEKGHGLAGGMTIAHLVDATGYSRAVVQNALRTLAARREARRVVPRLEDRDLFGPAGIWFQYFPGRGGR